MSTYSKHDTALLAANNGQFSLEWKLMQLHYDLRTTFTRYAVPYLPFKRWQHHQYKVKSGIDTEFEGIRWGVVRKNTDIVIEGFPRSGNTFASTAFRFAQTKPVKIAYRLHASAQLTTAVRMGVPAIVLIRDPEDAVLSWVIHRSHITIRQALKGYISFYASILPHHSYFVVADFKTVVTDFGSVIREVNEKFNKDFDEFIHTESNVKKCFELIDNFYRTAGDGKIPEKIVARPSEDRKKLKEALREQFQADSLVGMRKQAYDLYNGFLSNNFS